MPAQDAWPAYSNGLPDPNAIGAGRAFIWRSGSSCCCCVVVWAWVKSADWVGRDTEEMGDAIGMPARIWNPMIVFAPLVGFLLAITIPIFIAGWAVLLLGLRRAVRHLCRAAKRQGHQDKKVFTPEHLKNWLANLGKAAAGDKRRSSRPGKMGPPVELVAVGPLQMENQQALIEARQSPALCRR